MNGDSPHHARGYPLWAVTGPRSNPPTARRIAERALVLSAIAARGEIEGVDTTDPRFVEFCRDVVDWLRELDLSAEVETKEWAQLQTPLGGLAPQEEIDMSWRGEGAAVLAWALGRFVLPPYYRAVDPARVADSVGFLDDDLAAEVLEGAQLRSRAEIEALANLMFGLHWRLRDNARGKAVMDYRAFCRTAWFGPLETSGMEFSKNDLALEGVPVNAASDAQIATVRSIVVERQRAANWLLGQDEVYSAVSCDT